MIWVIVFMFVFALAVARIVDTNNSKKESKEELLKKDLTD